MGLAFPTRRMVLVCDNAAYHHKREIGSLGAMNKLELIKLCVDHDVDYLDLPVNINRMKLMGKDNEDIQDRGDVVRVTFNETEMKQRATINNPFVPSVEELMLLLLYFCRHYCLFSVMIVVVVVFVIFGFGGDLVPVVFLSSL
jgi:hypothetical protein